MKAYIKYHKNKYPKMTTQDIVKLLYQNHFGPGHFIKDIETIKNYYNHESNIINVNINNNLYEHIDEISGKTKEKLISDKEQAFFSKELATIYKEVPLDFDIEDIKYRGLFSSYSI